MCLGATVTSCSARDCAIHSPLRPWLVGDSTGSGQVHRVSPVPVWATLKVSRLFHLGSSRTLLRFSALSAVWELPSSTPLTHDIAIHHLTVPTNADAAIG